MTGISEITGSSGSIPSALKKAAPKGGSFGETFDKTLNEVNRMIQDANTASAKMATGDVDDIADVMIAAEKASIGLELVVEIRNKLLDSYRELMRMSV
jgi:flagellar hook-basal body complex protein FliE